MEKNNVMTKENVMEKNVVRLGLAVGLWLTLIGGMVRADDLVERFSHPSAEAQPWVYWYWMNGNVTREGIIADLQAMHEVGVGGVYLFDVGLHPAGSVINRSREWYDLVRLAFAEAQKRNMKINIHSPGWSASGGPWITPEMAMQELTWSETQVTGGQELKITLPQPATKLGYYRDVAVVAFPRRAGDDLSLRELKPRVTDLQGKEIPDVQAAFDGDWNTVASLPCEFVLVFDRPIEARSLFIRTARANVSFRGTLQAWDEGKGTFGRVAEIRSTASGPFSAQTGDTSFPAVKANKFLLSFNHSDPQARTIIEEMNLSCGFRQSNWAALAGFSTECITKPVGQQLPAGAQPGADDVIAPDQIIDLSGKVASDGKLVWQAPAGRWTILRLGHTPTGVKISPPPAGGDGLECDKMSREAVDFHYDHFMGPLLKELGPELSRSLACQHVDSYEAGWQNWTREFPREFKSRRGYEVLKYLPALTGRVVGDSRTTERFLWDFRRTISDLYAVHHYGRLAERSHQDGIGFSTEPYGGPFDTLQVGAQADLPMVEFWVGTRMPTQKMSFEGVFAGRTNGKKVIAAESFTSESPAERWNNHPYSLKSYGDVIFCSGVNRFVMHVSAHQSYVGDHLRPGLTCGINGIHFDRNNTWWNHGAKSWVDYLTRCQSLLQYGLHVADALYFQGSESPASSYWLTPALPKGYDFDACADNVLQAITVRQGRLVLPDGKDYRYLVLPTHGWITRNSLAKVVELAKAGATVVSAVLPQSPSQADALTGQGQWQDLARELWGDAPASQGERRVGAGRVIWGTGFAELLAKDALVPDFACDENAAMPLNVIHRQTPEADVYFVANAGSQAGWVNCRFRMKGKVPELWHPDSGAIERCAVYEQGGDSIRVPIYFEPSGSAFVVFRNKTAPGMVVASVQKDGHDVLVGVGAQDIELKQGESGGLEVQASKPGSYVLRFSNGQARELNVTPPAPLPLGGPWQLAFPAGWGAPEKLSLEKLISWSEHPDAGVRYFSGTATYQTMFTLPSELLAAHRALYLDLGDVQVIAEVRLNGRDLGTLWKPPFRVDVTDVLKAGSNELQVKVTNLWPNRLIGDEQYPDDCTPAGGWMAGGIPSWPEWLKKGQPRPEPRRLTFTAQKCWKKDEPLLPSGLTGPVVIRAVEQSAVSIP